MSYLEYMTDQENDPGEELDELTKSILELYLENFKLDPSRENRQILFGYAVSMFTYNEQKRSEVMQALTDAVNAGSIDSEFRLKIIKKGITDLLKPFIVTFRDGEIDLVRIINNSFSSSPEITTIALTMLKEESRSRVEDLNNRLRKEEIVLRELEDALTRVEG